MGGNYFLLLVKTQRSAVALCAICTEAVRFTTTHNCSANNRINTTRPLGGKYNKALSSLCKLENIFYEKNLQSIFILLSFSLFSVFLFV